MATLCFRLQEITTPALGAPPLLNQEGSIFIFRGEPKAHALSAENVGREVRKCWGRSCEQEIKALSLGERVADGGGRVRGLSSP
jgi:hypothetical protein